MHWFENMVSEHSLHHAVLTAHDYVEPYQKVTRPSQQSNVPILDLRPEHVSIACSEGLKGLVGKEDVLGRPLTAKQVRHLRDLSKLGIVQWRFAQPTGDPLHAQLVFASKWTDPIPNFATKFRNFLERENRRREKQ